MLQIAAEQQAVLAEQRFISKLVCHWQDCFPQWTRGMSHDAVKRQARRAWAEAEARGLATEADILVWSDLCIATRSCFATGWAGAAAP